MITTSPYPPEAVACDFVSSIVSRATSVDRIEENFGKKIDNLSADKAFGTGANLEGMETRNVNFHTPVESPAPQEGNPAKREDPRQPVPEADWPKLPRNDKKKLDKSSFVYDAEANCTIVPWDVRWTTNRPNAKRDGKRDSSIGVATAKGVRWRGIAASQTPSGDEAFRGRV